MPLNSEQMISVSRAGTLGNPNPVKGKAAAALYKESVAFAKAVAAKGGVVEIPHEVPGLDDETGEVGGA